MAYVIVTFDFRETNTGEESSDSKEFDVSSTLNSDIDNHTDEWIDENNGQTINYECETSWVFIGWSYSEWDDDFKSPVDFKSPDEYGEYVELCEKHGEGYKLRYDDIGEHDFDDEYNGCFATEVDFARDLFEGCYDIPTNLACYIDWEHVTRDILMDYSTYEGSEGVHIFRD